MKEWLRHILPLLLAVLLPAGMLRAQDNGVFKSDAFSQSYADPSDTLGRDSTDAAFTFKEYFGGMTHRRDARIGVMFAGSTVFLGGQQIHNHQTWKVPVACGAMAAGAGAGLYYRHRWKAEDNKDFQHMSNWFFAGAGLAYWATLMDGVYNYKKEIRGQAGKATLYSLLLPGLGQAYNGEFWKIPIYYGCLITSTNLLITNHTNYKRFKRIHNEASDTETDYTGPIAGETALYYRNVYRRYRDYSAVAVLGFYLLQVIDANVFAYMQDFELDDNIAMQVSPAVIDSQYALSGNPSGGHMPLPGQGGVGIRLGITF